jgi:hypothetical protein
MEGHWSHPPNRCHKVLKLHRLSSGIIPPQWSSFCSPKPYFPMSLGKSSLTLYFVFHFSLIQNCALGITCKYSICSLIKGLMSFSMDLVLKVLGLQSWEKLTSHFQLTLLTNLAYRVSNTINYTLNKCLYRMEN